jgi:hypothetical protein
MKTTIKSILAAVLILGTLPGCQKYLDDASVNPNDPEVATASSLLATIEVATFNNYAAGNARRTAILTQQMAGTDGQMIQLANYQILEGDVTNEWKSIYADAVVNCNLLISTYGDKNPYYAGLAKIFKAMNIGLATSMWGDVPFSEAGNGLDDVMSPKYDSQESIYAGLQSLLSEAIDDLSKDASTNAYFPNGDFVYGGSPDAWIRAAWMLKARYANHLSGRNPSGSASDALTYIANAGATGSEDDLNAIFGEGGTELNQWFAFEAERAGYIRMGQGFIDSLVAHNDPRLSYYAAEDEDGGYSGSSIDPDAADLATSPIGAYYASPGSISPIMSFVELKFIEAEARLRSGDAAGASTAHNDAVKASILQVTGASDAAYETAYASETSSSISLQKIMTQKYYALFTQVEVWNDWRRTNLPALSPNPSGSVSGIPTILPTSQDERLYNTNASVVTNLLQKVWWDVD